MHVQQAAWLVAAGLVAVGVALGAGELATGALRETSLVVGVGQYVIDHAPGAAARFAIDVFGTHDKDALVVAVIALSFVLGAVAGLLASWRFVAGAALIAVLGLAGSLAAADDPAISGSKAGAAAVFAAGAGILVLFLLTRAAPRRASEAQPQEPEAVIGLDRRKFLRLSGGAIGLALASVFTGRWVFGPAVDIEGERGSVRLPSPPPSSAPQVSAEAAALRVDGISPLITPNEDFYRIDTALTVPGLDVERWRLRVSGLVDEPYEITYRELLDMGVREETVTLCCVSNEVGGDLVGNARWLGVSLAALLERAGLRPEGTQIVARSVDGFTTAFPTAVALDGRPSMVAVGMNGEVLPASHGFPARMIVPGLYGYVSATKWLREIEVATQDFDAYWITRGWAKQGPIKTQSRIDVPDGTATIDPGPIQVGGVAWAGDRGIRSVEVRMVDAAAAEEMFGDAWIRDMDPEYGDWRQATLSDELSQNAWRQWVVDLDPSTPGEYLVEVRATDGLGDTQTNARHEPPPDGATGYDGFKLTVTGGA